jgi:hypothetical protein
MWVDFARIYDGLTHGDLEDAEPGVDVVAGGYLVVGDDDAEPAVAQVVKVEHDGVVLLRVLPGPAQTHLALLAPSHSTGRTS